MKHPPGPLTPSLAVEAVSLPAPYLLELEDVLIEVVMQPLVSVVDAELLKAVVAKVFKTEDVQHTDGVAMVLTVVFFGKKCMVDLQHDPVKQAAI